MQRMQSRELAERRILLGLLQSVDRDGGRTQRVLAKELGIALGLLNAYLKRTIRKGYVKARAVPARRFVYYLTPRGLAEKSRLTVEYLTTSLAFFRQTRSVFSAVLNAARERGIKRIVLTGMSELTEIAIICAWESGIKVVAVVDANSAKRNFINVPVVPSFDAVPEVFDAILVTSSDGLADNSLPLLDRFGADRVILPSLLDRIEACAATET